MTISGTGKCIFNDLIPNIDLNLQLAINNFMLFDAENLKIVVNGTGSMTGPLNDITISGDVVIPKCEIQNFATGEEKLDLVFENDNYLNTSDKPQPQSFIFKYNVSMRCDKITLIGKIFEIYLHGNLLLSTYQNTRTLVGDLNLINGKLNLFGKRLNFTQGNVTFLRDFPFDPKVTFKCLKNLGDLVVELEIKNNPQKGALLNLHSTPNYTQDVILSKMLFGKETKYLTVGEAAQLASAVAGLKQRGYIFSVLNTFQNVGIVDNISFISANDNQSDTLYTNHKSTTEKGNTSISAGKYINDNVYISVNKKGEETSFDVDFSITPRISIKANSLGEAGISWKYRY
jgi:translocation and assembly module TamB